MSCELVNLHCQHDADNLKKKNKSTFFTGCGD